MNVWSVIGNYEWTLTTAEVMMKLLLSLLLVALARLTIQQCTTENFENRIALDLLFTTQASDFRQNFTINRIIYNCLSTSQTIGTFRGMSVSMLFIRSDNPDRVRTVRFDMVCIRNSWMRRRQFLVALTSNDTRTDCSNCVADENENHCTRKPWAVVVNSWIMIFVMIP